MFEIDNEKLEILKALLNPNNSHYPLLKSILSNNKKGKAYVDCINKPSVAGVLSSDNWFYLLGKNMSKAFSKSLEDLLFENIVVNKEPILWFGISNYWKTRLHQNTSIVVEDYPRNEYEFNEENYKSFAVDYPEYKLKAISKNNIDDLFRYSEGLHNFWQTKELFLEQELQKINIILKRIIYNLFFFTFFSQNNCPV